MDKEELNFITEQIRCIALCKPIPDNIKCKSTELLEIQSGLDYLSTAYMESNDFLNNLTVGVLDIETPKTYSATASSLKDLHSKLRHLTWQADQVARGNYSQNVSFLGEFSASFNEMVKQLSQREQKLKEQSMTLSQSIDLLKTIMDVIQDYVIVTAVENNDIIYINESARETFFEKIRGKHSCIEDCDFFIFLKEQSIKAAEENKESIFYEYSCKYSNTTLYTTSFSIYWNEQLAYVHYIKDTTNELEYKLEMEKMIYKDTLTDIYNRRFCIKKIQSLIDEKVEFTCCLIDIDDLKYANDNFGHKSGDEYIKVVVQQIKNNFCEKSLLCRLGGDEFIIICIGDCYDQIIERMEKTDAALINLSREYPMSISYGVISIDENSNMDCKDILEKTDQKMYEFKKKRKQERVK